MSAIDQPERHMAVRALVPGALAALIAFGLGYAVNGLEAGVCALLGVVVVTASFSVCVLVLGGARRVSAGAMQAATLGGWLVRLGVIVGSLAVVNALGGDVAAFGFAAIGAASAVAVYGGWFVVTGRPEPPPADTPATATADTTATPAAAAASPGAGATGSGA